MTNTDLAFASIEELAQLYRKRKLSPVEVTKLMLARIDHLNPKLNAYITVTADLALAQAKKAESELFAPRGRKGHRDRGPLHGIPISLKDNIYTKGIRTTAGSKILQDFVPENDAAVWAKLREAGAILLGKTNLHEFAYGVTTNNPHYGPTRNPWDLTRIPGGSSGGSAAAVAAGLCYGSIGTDTGGSIRIPASLCGVVGLKPGIGRVTASAHDGVVPLSATLDSLGTLARSMRDAATVLDPIFLHTKNDSPLHKVRNHPGKLRVGALDDFFPTISDEIGRVFYQALRSIEMAGGTLRNVSIPLLNDVEEAGNNIAWAEATHYHETSGWFPSRSAEYGDDVRSRLETGKKVSATTYLQALEIRERFRTEVFRVMTNAKLDFLAIPTTPITAPLIGEESTQIGETTHSTRALLLRLNRPANLAGIPAISLPCGFTPAGLPVGLQLINLITREPFLISMAQAVEGVLPRTPRPRL